MDSPVSNLKRGQSGALLVEKPSKRSKCSASLPMKSTTMGKLSQAVFLDFHFRVLQSLYSYTNNTSTAQDLWTLTRAFLKERSQLIKCKQDADIWQGVAEHAQEFAESTPSAVVASTPLLSNSSPFFSRSCDDGPRHSFSLVARLLQRQQVHVFSAYQYKVDSARELMILTDHEIKDISKQLEAHNREISERQLALNWSSGNDEGDVRCPVYSVETETDRSLREELETKLKLWKLLHKDLQNILGD